jgi:hypothetical protein
MPVPQLAEVAVEALASQPELISYLDRSIDPNFRELSATDMGGLHGEPVVLVGMYEPLRGEPMDLDFPSIELEVLRSQAKRDQNAATYTQPNHTAIHAESSTMVVIGKTAIDLRDDLKLKGRLRRALNGDALYSAIRD